MRTIGLVQWWPKYGRRLAGRTLGGSPLIEWVVRRVSESAQLDAVAVVAPQGPECDRLSRLVPPDVRVIAGDPDDALAGLISALNDCDASEFVRIEADCLFVDAELIDRLVTAARADAGLDYVGYCFADGRPAATGPVGVFSEWCTAEALRLADDLARRPRDRRNVTRYVYSNPERFRVRWIGVPAGLNRHDVRLTVDCDEDWEHTQQIVEALGPEQLDWQRIAELLNGQPALRERMATLNRSGAGT